MKYNDDLKLQIEDEFIEQDEYGVDPTYRIKTEYPEDDTIGFDDYNQDEYAKKSRRSLRDYANSLMKSNDGYNEDYSTSRRSRPSLKVKDEYPYDDGYYPHYKNRKI